MNAQTLKAWNKWYAQIETYWALQEIAHRMMHLGLLRGFEQWLSIRVKHSAMSRRERAWSTMFKMRKLTRAWRLWRTNAHEQIARGRIRDTFHFSKKVNEEALDPCPLFAARCLLFTALTALPSRPLFTGRRGGEVC